MDADAKPGGSASDAAAALADVVRPRLVGSTGWVRTRDVLQRRFAGLGYDVRPLSCHASVLPGRWGVPAAGFALLAGSLAGVLALYAGERPAALFALLLGGALAAGVAFGAARATDTWTSGRVRLENLWIQHAQARPRWVFVAHLDSKSQFVPLLLRAAAAGAAIAAWMALIIVALLGGPLARSAVLLAILAGVAIGAGAALLLSGAGNRSPGALDDGSGLATLLGLAASEADSRDIAFLVTDGEEIGLAGSRGIAATLPPVEGIINIDGIDDDGPFHVLERFGPRRRGRASHLAMPILSAAAALDMNATRRDVPIGLLLDHMSFVNAGIPALTLMRGTLRSMARVHRPSDDLDRLSGRGVADAVDLLRAALLVLRRNAARTDGGGVAGDPGRD
jgi:hypothetical protein